VPPGTGNVEPSADAASVALHLRCQLDHEDQPIRLPFESAGQSSLRTVYQEREAASFFTFAFNMVFFDQFCGGWSAA
jgi:hypothetical protein